MPNRKTAAQTLLGIFNNTSNSICPYIKPTVSIQLSHQNNKDL